MYTQVHTNKVGSWYAHSLLVSKYCNLVPHLCAKQNNDDEQQKHIHVATTQEKNITIMANERGENRRKRDKYYLNCVVDLFLCVYTYVCMSVKYCTRFDLFHVNFILRMHACMYG